METSSTAARTTSAPHTSAAASSTAAQTTAIGETSTAGSTAVQVSTPESATSSAVSPSTSGTSPAALGTSTAMETTAAASSSPAGSSSSAPHTSSAPTATFTSTLSTSSPFTLSTSMSSMDTISTAAAAGTSTLEASTAASSTRTETSSTAARTTSAPHSSAADSSTPAEGTSTTVSSTAEVSTSEPVTTTPVTPSTSGTSPADVFTTTTKEMTAEVSSSPAGSSSSAPHTSSAPDTTSGHHLSSSQTVTTSTPTSSVEATSTVQGTSTLEATTAASSTRTETSSTAARTTSAPHTSAAASSTAEQKSALQATSTMSSTISELSTSEVSTSTAATLSSSGTSPAAPVSSTPMVTTAAASSSPAGSSSSAAHTSSAPATTSALPLSTTQTVTNLIPASSVATASTVPGTTAFEATTAGSSTRMEISSTAARTTSAPHISAAASSTTAQTTAAQGTSTTGSSTAEVSTSEPVTTIPVSPSTSGTSPADTFTTTAKETSAADSSSPAGSSSSAPHTSSAPATTSTLSLSTTERVTTLIATSSVPTASTAAGTSTLETTAATSPAMMEASSTAARTTSAPHTSATASSTETQTTAAQGTSTTVSSTAEVTTSEADTTSPVSPSTSGTSAAAAVTTSPERTTAAASSSPADISSSAPHTGTVATSTTQTVTTSVPTSTLATTSTAAAAGTSAPDTTTAASSTRMKTSSTAARTTSAAHTSAAASSTAEQKSALQATSTISSTTSELSTSEAATSTAATSSSSGISTAAPVSTTPMDTTAAASSSPAAPTATFTSTLSTSSPFSLSTSMSSMGTTSTAAPGTSTLVATTAASSTRMESSSTAARTTSAAHRTSAASSTAEQKSALQATSTMSSTTSQLSTSEAAASTESTSSSAAASTEVPVSSTPSSSPAGSSSSAPHTSSAPATTSTLSLGTTQTVTSSTPTTSVATTSTAAGTSTLEATTAAGSTRMSFSTAEVSTSQFDTSTAATSSNSGTSPAAPVTTTATETTAAASSSPAGTSSSAPHKSSAPATTSTLPFSTTQTVTTSSPTSSVATTFTAAAPETSTLEASTAASSTRTETSSTAARTTSAPHTSGAASSTAAQGTSTPVSSTAEVTTSEADTTSPVSPSTSGTSPAAAVTTSPEQTSAAASSSPADLSSSAPHTGTVTTSTTQTVTTSVPTSTLATTSTATAAGTSAPDTTTAASSTRMESSSTAARTTSAPHRTSAASSTADQKSALQATSTISSTTSELSTSEVSTSTAVTSSTSGTSPAASVSITPMVTTAAGSSSPAGSTSSAPHTSSAPATTSTVPLSTAQTVSSSTPTSSVATTSTTPGTSTLEATTVESSTRAETFTQTTAAQGTSTLLSSTAEVSTSEPVTVSPVTPSTSGTSPAAPVSSTATETTAAASSSPADTSSSAPHTSSASTATFTSTLSTSSPFTLSTSITAEVSTSAAASTSKVTPSTSGTSAAAAVSTTPVQTTAAFSSSPAGSSSAPQTSSGPATTSTLSLTTTERVTSSIPTSSVARTSTAAGTSTLKVTTAASSPRMATSSTAEKSTSEADTTSVVTSSSSGTSPAAPVNTTPMETTAVASSSPAGSSSSASTATFTSTLSTSSPFTLSTSMSSVATTSTATAPETTTLVATTATSTAMMETSSTAARTTSAPHISAAASSTETQTTAAQGTSTISSSTAEVSTSEPVTTIPVTPSSSGTSAAAPGTSTATETTAAASSSPADTSSSAPHTSSAPTATFTSTLSTSSPFTLSTSMSSVATTSTATAPETTTLVATTATSTAMMEASSTAARTTSAAHTSAAASSTAEQKSALQATSAVPSTTSELSTSESATSTEATSSSAAASTEAPVSSTASSSPAGSSSSAPHTSSAPATTSTLPLSTTERVTSSMPTSSVATASTAPGTSTLETTTATSPARMETSSTAARTTSAPHTSATASSTAAQTTAAEGTSTIGSSTAEVSTSEPVTTIPGSPSSSETSPAAPVSSTASESTEGPSSSPAGSSSSAPHTSSAPATTALIPLGTTQTVTTSTPTSSAATTSTAAGTSTLEATTAASSARMETSSTAPRTTSAPHTSAAASSTAAQTTSAQETIVFSTAPVSTSISTTAVTASTSGRTTASPVITMLKDTTAATTPSLTDTSTSAARTDTPTTPISTATGSSYPPMSTATPTSTPAMSFPSPTAGTSALPSSSFTFFSSPPTTTAAALEHFTINFTTTNLPYSSDLRDPDSAKFSSTRRVMNTLLDRLLKKSSIGAKFLGCETKGFRPVRAGAETGVDAVCSYRKEPSGLPLDRVGLYHEVSNHTKGITKLGPYSLDKDSLYVNGYNEQPVLTTPSPPTTTAAALEHFTINITTTNLPYSSDLRDPDSAKFSSTRRVMNTLLDRLLKKSSIGAEFLGCETKGFRPVRAGAETGVDAVCSYRKEPSGLPLDRVGLYHEVSNHTKGITKLGPYSLDKDSLYVNGYNEQPVLTTPSPPTPTAAALEHFTINFTTTNLPYSSDLRDPDSAKFSSTRRVMNTLLDRLLKKSSIGAEFLGCETKGFRPVRAGAETGVDAVCSYRKEPSGLPLDRVGLYHEVSNHTKGITKLGPYSLDKDSLYVNGYNEQPVLTTQSAPTTTAAALEHFTINFTTTNLPYSSDLRDPDSAKFSSTRRVMNTLLDRLLKKSSIGAKFLGCETKGFRPVRAGAETGVDAVCSYRKEPSGLPLDRVGLYHEVSNHTKGITKLGPYSLDKDSLYVNGYNEQPVLTTPSPPTTTAAALEHFTINFTTTNLPYSSDLRDPDSAKFSSTRRVMNTLLDRLLKKSSIGAKFLGCETKGFRPVRAGAETGVDAVCSYRKEPSGLPLDRVGLYHEVSNHTKGITKLGPYSLDKDSLYVNGYNEQPVLTTPSAPTTTAAALEHFTINFTTTNLPYSSDLRDPDSAKFSSTRRVMNTLLDRLLKKSSIGAKFLGCETKGFRPVRAGAETGVDAVCSYRKEPSGLPLDRVGLYHEVSNHTKGITKLGPYSLDKDSLYVNGYNEQPVLTTPSAPTTTAAALEHFTINITTTNLPYSSDLRDPDSAKFSSTRRVMNTLLDRLLKKSSIGAKFLGCETKGFRPVRAGAETGVDAVCSYRKEPSGLPLDRVGLYHEVSNHTKGITKLGPYSLDKDSLYVNGYNEQPVLTTPSPPTTTAAALEHFTINFTTTNLPYSSDLQDPDSAKFSSTRRVMNTLLDRLLKKSSIGAKFLGCETKGFRPVRAGAETGVDAVCSYRKEPSGLPLDRVGLYHEVSNHTKGITKLGPYSLDKDSLYVNGYNEQPVLTTPSPPTTTAAALEHFTINFTTTNLPYSSDLRDPDSAKFSSTRRVMNTLLDRLLKKSSIGAKFLGCETKGFRPVRAGAETGVDAVCSYRKEPSGLPLDRVGLYHEVSNHTKGITKLGPYSLDKDSLYVNGYNEQPVLTTPSPPTTTAAALEHFTINFTTTNLPYSSDLQDPDSAKFSSTRRVMNTLLDRLLKKSSIGAKFLGCETKGFRPVRAGAETGVDAVCSYRKEPSGLPLDRVGLYHEVSNHTKGITKLGPYSLDKDSLYVNGYNEQPVLTTPSPPTTTAAALEHFTINFTTTNLPYSSDLRDPDSAKFSSTRRVMNTLLDRLLKKSSIGAKFLGCETKGFRPVRAGAETGVDAVCSYRKEPSGLPLDRVGLYHEVSNHTKGITKLGPYSLDKDSLYVNGYNEQPVLTTPSPPTTTAAALEHFTINFTTTNLPYSSDLQDPDSAKFSSTRRVMNTLLDRLLKKSSIGAKFLGCETKGFRPVRAGAETGVDAVCSYRKEPSGLPLDRVGLYHEVSNHTKGITKLGPYSLDKDSLYVNGYNEQPVLTTPSPPTTTAAALEHFTINFTTTNLPYSSDLRDPDSAKFSSTRRVMNTLLDRLLKKSSIGAEFLGCETKGFRPVRAGAETGVDAVCSYRKEPSGLPLDRVGLYHEVSNHTKGITKLGPYSLDKDSLYVNGYNEQPILTTPSPPTTAAALEHFTINFTTTNLPYSSDLRDPDSAKFSSTRRVMNTLLDRLLKKSSIGAKFLGCETKGFRPVRAGAETGVDAVCSYRKEPSGLPLDRVGLYHEVSNHTKGITKLGPYSLDKDSLYVNGYNEPLQRSALRTTPAPSPAASNFTLNFTLTNLRYTADLTDPSSRRFLSTVKVINHYVDSLLRNSSIGSVYKGCKLLRFRSGRHRDHTGIDAVCSYQNDANLAKFNREKVYHELSTMTDGVTKLGHYSLDNNSLYVDGFPLREAAVIRKPAMAEAPARLGYRLSFRIVNENLSNSDSRSPEYKAAVESISKKMNQLYLQSSLRDQFLNCSITRLRAGSIMVDCNCFFQSEPSINRAVVERAFQDGASNTSGLWLGSSYQLQGFSVDNLELAIEAATHRTPLKSGKENFRLNFRISNLPYSPELQDPSSQRYQVTKENIEKELEVFRSSSLKDYFIGCTLESFGPVHGKPYTEVVSICKFILASSRTLEKQEVYEELAGLTQGFSKLGSSYRLEEQSLVVEGYSPIKTEEHQSERPELQFWAIILICVFILIGFILLLLLCFLIASCLRRKSDLYQVQQSIYGVYFPHPSTSKVH
ncbi:mucin-16-like [Pogoniulus pusillus]|uniref:mucin-16-like n=1 Tax=Pogoniulus pusillus TaxID=488313 RepID=UPI0030B96157